jgi:hypothetical protein
MARLNPTVKTQSGATPNTAIAAATKANTTKAKNTDKKLNITTEADRSTKTPKTNLHKSNEEKTDETKRFKPVISPNLAATTTCARDRTYRQE